MTAKTRASRSGTWEALSIKALSTQEATMSECIRPDCPMCIALGDTKEKKNG